MLSNKHNIDMRTTVTLNDDIATIAAQYAESRDLSLSKAFHTPFGRLSGTAGLFYMDQTIAQDWRSARIKYVDGLPVFDLPKSKHPITSERVKALEIEEP